MKMQSLVTILTILSLTTAFLPLFECAKKPVASARKEDIPYIKCQVCQKLAKELYNQVNTKQSQISPKKMSEYQIIEIAENVCNLKKSEADWIMKIDIVEQGDQLELVEQDVEGQCNSECKTVEKACQDVMGYSDTDVAEYIYSSKPQLDSLVNYLCKDLTKSCSKKPPPVPKDRTPGEPFVPKPSNEAEMERLMKSMEGMPGAPGMKMYSREQLMNGGFGKEDADDDDEDDDDDTKFSSNLGKVLREKGQAKGDWKEKITKGITNAGVSLKRHADKMSYRIQHWWKGMKAGKSKKSKAGKSEL